MERKTKFINMTVKSIDENGTIEGYGNTFGNTDSYGDVVQKGAFTKTLKDRAGKIKMLWQHQSSQIIGKWEFLGEDSTGLKVRGKLFVNKGIPAADQAYTLLKEGELDGLSIGYSPITYDYNDTGGINIKEAKLYEVSLVTFPANEESTITGIKAEFDNLESAFEGLDEEKRIKTLQFINNLKQTAPESTTQPPTVEASTGNTVTESEAARAKDNKPLSPTEDETHLLEQLIEALKQRKEMLR